MESNFHLGTIKFRYVTILYWSKIFYKIVAWELDHLNILSTCVGLVPSLVIKYPKQLIENSNINIGPYHVCYVLVHIDYRALLSGCQSPLDHRESWYLWTTALRRYTYAYLKVWLLLLFISFRSFNLPNGRTMFNVFINKAIE